MKLPLVHLVRNSRFNSIPAMHGWQHLLYQSCGIPLVRGRRSAAFLAQPAGPMERLMFREAANGEVYGGNVLYGAMIAGAVFIMLAALWAPAPAPAQVAQSAAPIEQIVVVAHPGHIS